MSRPPYAKISPHYSQLPKQKIAPNLYLLEDSTMKLAICNEMFENWKIEDVFDCAAQLGYQGVEIAPFTLADDIRDISTNQRNQIKQDAANSQIEIVGLHWLLVSPKGLYVNHPQAEIREQTLDYFLALIDLCADLEGQMMIIGSPQQRSIQEGWDAAQTWDYARETFTHSAAYAQDKGVVLCMEPLSDNQTNFINTPAQAVEMIRQVDFPNFQLILDVCSTANQGLDMPSEIRQFSDHLAHFHTNDNNLYLPGSGDVDYSPIISALTETSYDGYLSTEVFNFEPDPVTIASQSINFLRNIINN